MKSTLKMKICDWWSGEGFYENYFIKSLGVKYNIIESENPDYILYSVFGYEHTKYDCIRIFFTGENICPDFNICDYAIGFSYISFEDRYIRYPLYLLNQNDIKRAINKHKINKKIINNKNKFCNYIYSHSNSSKVREKFFDALSEYKKVDSAGSYRNNIGKSLPVINGDFSTAKFDFMKDYKFSIAFENSSTNGYVTEKIIQAFSAKTIPIYWGDKTLSSGGGGINEKAFINMHSFNSFESAIERIIEIDNNDELFINILKEPIFINPSYHKIKYKELMDFFDNIFSQSFKNANRRKNEHWFKNYNFAYLQMTAMINLRMKIHKYPLAKFLRKIKVTKIIKNLLKI